MTGAVAALGGVALLSFGIVSEGFGGTPSYYTLNSDGRKQSSDDPSGATRWITNGAPGNYEAFVSINSGTLSSGTTGSWLALTATQTWQKSSGTCAFRLQVRDAFTLTNVADVTITLSA